MGGARINRVCPTLCQLENLSKFKVFKQLCFDKSATLTSLVKGGYFSVCGISQI